MRAFPWQETGGFLLGVCQPFGVLCRVGTVTGLESGSLVNERQSLRPGSVEIMFRTYYRGLVRSLAVAAGGLSLAEDAVQEAFARAHISWRRIGAYDDPVAWVRRVAINRIKDQSLSAVAAHQGGLS